MEQFIFLLVIAAISLIKWLMEKSAEQRAKRQLAEKMDRSHVPAPPIRAPRPTASPIPDIDAAARRLRDALGLPEESEVPPVRKPAPEPVMPPPVPVVRVEEVEGAPLVDLEQRVVLPPLIPEVVLPPPRVADKIKQRAATPARSNVDTLLRSREGLRKAILAQEILGTPKGLVF